MRNLLITLILFNINLVYGQLANDYFQTTVTFPGSFAKGDFIEFVQSTPYAAEASGYYEVSIAYTRGDIAAAATHIVSSSHANYSRWLEAGRINNNVYTEGYINFTVDHNPSTKSFRIRAINNYGTDILPIIVYIKIRSINFNSHFISINNVGNTTLPINLLPMTYDWDLVVGNSYIGDGILAIKALHNGNVGIGVVNPNEKLSVAGTIHSQEVKVSVDSWPDYVFKDEYELSSLENIHSFIKKNGHLPGVPKASEVEQNGIQLGEMNKILLQKIEELTLHLIKKDNEILEIKKYLKLN